MHSNVFFSITYRYIYASYAENEINNSFVFLPHEMYHQFTYCSFLTRYKDILIDATVYYSVLIPF